MEQALQSLVRGYSAPAPLAQAAMRSASQCNAARAAAYAKAGAGRTASGPLWLPHISKQAAESLEQAGKLVQGEFTAPRGSHGERGQVRWAGQTVEVPSPLAVNRALHGDKVWLWRAGEEAAGMDARTSLLSSLACALCPGFDPASGADPAAALTGASASIGPDDLQAAISRCAVREGCLGMVVGIVQRGCRSVPASFPVEEVGQAGHRLVGAVPLSSRLPKVMVQGGDTWVGRRILVAVASWTRQQQDPHGNVMSSLGDALSVDAEVTAVLHATDTAQHAAPHGDRAVACLPPTPSPPASSASRYAWSAAWQADHVWRLLGHPAQDTPAHRLWQSECKVVQSATSLGRRDLRSSHAGCMTSIDPPGCQDIDDVLSVRRLGGGKVEFGVHIADVAHFVRMGSPLDAEAAGRGTTVYLPHKRMDMLPAALSECLCSLRPGVDRYAFSMLWVVDVDGGDEEGGDAWVSPATGAYNPPPAASSAPGAFSLCPDATWVGLSVIRSTAAMTYEQAQALADGRMPATRPDSAVHDLGMGQDLQGEGGSCGDPLPADEVEGLRWRVRMLLRFARWTQARREECGSVALTAEANEGAELRFKLDPETGKPVGVVRPDHVEMHGTIAELMVLGNAQAAALMCRHVPELALVRHHTPAQGDSFGRLLALARAGKLPALQDASHSNAALAHALQALQGAALTAEAYALLVSTATQAMTEAKYAVAGRLAATAKVQEAGLQGGDLARTYTAHTDLNATGTSPSAVARVMTWPLAHYGIGLNLYTHFTSPIRRYADLMVHRLLREALGLPIPHVAQDQPLLQTTPSAESEAAPALPQAQLPGDDLLGDLLDMGPPPGEVDVTIHDPAPTDIQCTSTAPANTQLGAGRALFSATNLAATVQHLNDRTRAARQVSRECQHLFAQLHLSGRAEVHTGVVHSVHETGLTVWVPRYDVKVRCHLASDEGVAAPPDLIPAAETGSATAVDRLSAFLPSDSPVLAQLHELHDAGHLRRSLPPTYTLDVGDDTLSIVAAGQAVVTWRATDTVRVLLLGEGRASAPRPRILGEILGGGAALPAQPHAPPQERRAAAQPVALTDQPCLRLRQGVSCLSAGPVTVEQRGTHVTRSLPAAVAVGPDVVTAAAKLPAGHQAAVARRLQERGRQRWGLPGRSKVQLGNAATSVVGVRFGVAADRSGFGKTASEAALQRARGMRLAGAGGSAATGAQVGQLKHGHGGQPAYAGTGTGAMSGSAAALLKNTRAIKAAEAAASARMAKVSTAVRKGKAAKRASRKG